MIETKREYIYPHEGVIISRYGMRVHPVTGQWKMHNGIDIDGETGDTLRAVASGVVDFTGYSPTGGNMVIIKHDKHKSVYLHLDSIWVCDGQVVSKGEIIGTMGATGQVTGSHLHFALKDFDENFLDPELFLSK